MIPSRHIKTDLQSYDIHQSYWFNGRLSVFQLVSICFSSFITYIPGLCESLVRKIAGISGMWLPADCLCHLCSMFLRGSIAKHTAKHTSRFQQNAKKLHSKNNQHQICRLCLAKDAVDSVEQNPSISKTHFLGCTACLPNSCLPNIEIHLRMPHLFGALTHWTKNVIPPFPRFSTVPLQCHGKYWVCLKIGYIPNEIAIFWGDNDQQNHWVQWGLAYFQTHPIVKEQQTATTATGRGVSSFHFSQGFLNGKAFRAVQATALLPGIAFIRTSTKHDQFSWIFMGISIINGVWSWSSPNILVYYLCISIILYR